MAIKKNMFSLYFEINIYHKKYLKNILSNVRKFYEMGNIFVLFISNALDSLLIQG